MRSIGPRVFLAREDRVEVYLVYELEVECMGVVAQYVDGGNQVLCLIYVPRVDSYTRDCIRIIPAPFTKNSPFQVCRS
jgi:hypothetical protein